MFSFFFKISRSIFSSSTLYQGLLNFQLALTPGVRWRLNQGSLYIILDRVPLYIILGGVPEAGPRLQGFVEEDDGYEQHNVDHRHRQADVRHLKHSCTSVCSNIFHNQRIFSVNKLMTIWHILWHVICSTDCFHYAFSSKCWSQPRPLSLFTVILWSYLPIIFTSA